MTRALLATALLIGACHRHTELIDDGTIPGLVAIEITPRDNAVVIDDLAAVARVSLSAIGTFKSGDTRDITGEVEWAVDDSFLGGFAEPGIWESSNRAGGLVTAVARAGQIEGEVTIAVHFEPTIYDPSFPPPPGAGALFEPPTPVVTGDPASSPVIVYPSDDTLLPVNLHRTLFQFQRGAAADVHRIRFESDYLDLSVLTTNDRWQAEGPTWDYLARSAAGRPATMTVSGIDSADPATIWQSDPVRLEVSSSSVDGAIYFWSTSSEGVMKAVLSDNGPTRFYTEPPDTACVGCHTVSRDGTRLAVGYGGEVLQQVSVIDRGVEIPADRGYAMGWATYSPDSRYLLLASAGALRLLDAATGDPIGADGGALDLGGAQVTHPDWSPLGDHVAVALCEDARNNKDVQRCSIARIPVAGTDFGAPEILVPAAGGEDSNYFPRYSPDGAWIAYVNAAGRSKDQDGATLHLVPAAGGASIALERATSRVGPLDGVVATGSTMPTWAPAAGGSIQWLAFSSIRDYGTVLTGDKADQLWIAGLDMNRAAAGDDPSYAAFWLPVQDIDERNHRAFWAIDAAVGCTGQVEMCDGFDNDCDGVIDDDCVPCGDREVCIDGADNDCDGEVDDGCIE